MKAELIESWLVFVAAFVVVILGEVLLMQRDYLSGILLYAMYLEALLLYGAFRWASPQHQFLVLTIPAIIRLMNFTLPLGVLSPVFAQLVISVPMALTAVVFVWLFKQSAIQVTYERGRHWYYLGLVFIGGILGFILFQLSAPSNAPMDSSLMVFFYAFVLIVPMALLEEWLFRGIMQTALERAFGFNIAIPAVALFYVILHAGQEALSVTGVIFLVALLLGWLRRGNENLLGVWLLHSAINITYFLVLPLLFV